MMTDALVIGVVSTFAPTLLGIAALVTAIKNNNGIKKVHKIVNGERIILLSISATSARSLYEETKKPEHLKLAEAAEHALAVHTSAVVGLMRRRAYDKEIM
jgi:hypothetical protein